MNIAILRPRILGFCSNFRSYSTNGNHYDVIVAGGGMIGTTLTCALAKNSKLQNKKVLLLESAKKRDWKPSEKYSKRVSSLNQNTYNLLNSIGAWKHIAAFRFAPVKRMQVWDGCSEAMITFNNDDWSENIAYIVENEVLLNAVNIELEQCDNVKVCHEAKISNYGLPGESKNFVEVNMEDGEVYTCGLLVGADGANSKVRQAMGVQYVNWKYDQMGIVATLKLSEPTENVVAWQRFLPSGPIALLPLTDSLSSLVWSVSTAEAKRLVQLPEELFVDAVNEALWKPYPSNDIINLATRTVDNFFSTFGCRSSAGRQLPPSISGCDEKSRAAFPYSFGHATNYVAKSVVLVGDAAHRVHPLAGQGANLGFGDVRCLVEVLADAVYSGSTLGSLPYLRRYETLRQRHNVPTMVTIEGLQKLYSTEFTPVVVLRSLGLQITHALTPVKNVPTGNTGELVDWIGKIRIKKISFKRQRRKNLLAEAVLANALSRAEIELRRKQQQRWQKWQKLKTSLCFNVDDCNNVSSNSTNVKAWEDSSEDVNSLDSFMSQLKEVKCPLER